ncbi:MAG TPA: hypothetical protein GXZ43_08345 [Clostridiaceae bacterium]|nr:hypothetical protein [Clostridiaceae bacterium]
MKKSFEVKFDKIINSPLFVAFLINIFVFSLSLLFNETFNETNDDTGMSALVANAYGNSSDRLVFSNVIYAKILGFFYRLSGTINWYTIFQLALAFVSFTVIGYIFIHKLPKKTGILFFVLLLIMYYQEFYLINQFTRVSTICTLSGSLVLVYALNEDMKKRYIGLAIILIMLGFMIRYRSALPVLVFACFNSFFYIVIQLKNNKIKETLQQIKKYIITYALLFVLLFSLFIIDKNFYSSNTEWNNYTNHNKVRAQLLDYGWPNPWPQYDDYKDSYEKMGISSNDSRLYAQGILNDRDVLPDSKLEEILSFKKSVTGFKFDAKHFLHSFYTNIVKNRHLQIALIINILFLFAYGIKNKYLIMVIGFNFIFLLIFLYFYYLNRIVPRALTPMILVLTTFILFSFDKSINVVRTKASNILVVVLFMYVCISAYVGFPTYLKLKQDRLQVTELYDYLDNNKQDVFLASRDVFRWNYKFFNSLKVLPDSIYINQINIGGWLSRCPVDDSIKKNNNIQNEFEALVNKENVYLYTKNYEHYYETYLKEHYYEDISMSVIEVFDDWVKLVKFTRNMKVDELMECSNAQINKVVPNPLFKDYLDFLISVDSNEIMDGSSYYLEVFNLMTKEKKTYCLSLLKKSPVQDGYKLDLKVSIPLKDFPEYDPDNNNIYVFKLLVKNNDKVFACDIN